MKLFDTSEFEVVPFIGWGRRKGTGSLYCKTCHHRIPSRINSDPPIPKYPYCPWCGARVRGDVE